MHFRVIHATARRFYSGQTVGLLNHVPCMHLATDLCRCAGYDINNHNLARLLLGNSEAHPWSIHRRRKWAA